MKNLQTWTNMTIKKSANSEVYNFEGENRRFVTHKETEENSWRIGHLSNTSDLNSRDARHIFFAECIPHRVFVKVLHGIAVKRCRKRKDTASIQHPGGDVKRNKGDGRAFEYYWTEPDVRLPIVRICSSCLPSADARRPILTRKLPNWYTRILLCWYPITWNFFRERNFKTTGQFNVGDSAILLRRHLSTSLRGTKRVSLRSQFAIEQRRRSRKTRALINFSERSKRHGALRMIHVLETSETPLSHENRAWRFRSGQLRSTRSDAWHRDASVIALIPGHETHGFPTVLWFLSLLISSYCL